MIHVSDVACLDRSALHKKSGAVGFEGDRLKGLLGPDLLIYLVAECSYA